MYIHSTRRSWTASCWHGTGYLASDCSWQREAARTLSAAASKQHATGVELATFASGSHQSRSPLCSVHTPNQTWHAVFWIDAPAHYAEWTKNVRAIAQQCAASLPLDLPSQSEYTPESQNRTRAWLRKAMILDGGMEYCSELGSQAEPDAYGTMILIPMVVGQASVAG